MNEAPRTIQWRLTVLLDIFALCRAMARMPAEAAHPPEDPATRAIWLRARRHARVLAGYFFVPSIAVPVLTFAWWVILELQRLANGESAAGVVVAVLLLGMLALTVMPLVGFLFAAVTWRPLARLFGVRVLDGQVNEERSRENT
jgi:hypothetical protein